MLKHSNQCHCLSTHQSIPAHMVICPSSLGGARVASLALGVRGLILACKDLPWRYVIMTHLISVVEVVFFAALLDNSLSLDNTNYTGEWLSVCIRKK